MANVIFNSKCTQVIFFRDTYHSGTLKRVTSTITCTTLSTSTAGRIVNTRGLLEGLCGTNEMESAGRGRPRHPHETRHHVREVSHSHRLKVTSST